MFGRSLQEFNMKWNPLKRCSLLVQAFESKSKDPCKLKTRSSLVISCSRRRRPWSYLRLQAILRYQYFRETSNFSIINLHFLHPVVFCTIFLNHCNHSTILVKPSRYVDHSLSRQKACSSTTVPPENQTRLSHARTHVEFIGSL